MYLVYILLKLVILIYTITIDKYLEVILKFRLELCLDHTLKNLIT
jgi:hypothetical protein